MSKKELKFEGLSVSPGIGIGKAFVRESGAIAAPKYKIRHREINEEVERFHRAISRTARGAHQTVGDTRDRVIFTQPRNQRDHVHRPVVMALDTPNE